MDYQATCQQHYKPFLFFCLTCFSQSNDKNCFGCLLCMECSQTHVNHRKKQPEECFTQFKGNIVGLLKELEKVQKNLDQMQLMYQKNKKALKLSIPINQQQYQQQISHQKVEEQIDQCCQNLEQLKIQSQSLQSKQIPERYLNLYDLLYLAQTYKEVQESCDILTTLPQDQNILYLFSPSKEDFSPQFVPDIFK